MGKKKVKKKVTRIMKVTMDEEEFEKLDKGLTHSDGGVRNESGKISALPDIAPLSDSDYLPVESNSERESCPQVDCQKSLREQAADAITEASLNFFKDFFGDPEVRDSLSRLAKAWWKNKVVPKIDKTIQKLKDSNSLKDGDVTDNIEETEVVYEYEFVNENDQKIVVSEEQAGQLIENIKEEARKLSSMIYLLSNICVKDEKTNEEYMIERSYLRQLLSDESQNTMRFLLNNKSIIDNESAICFSDFLNGYIKNGNDTIPIKMIETDEE